jgi:hypothetical protein
MGLYDRDYMHQNRDGNSKRSSGGRGKQGPPELNWKDIVLGLSLVANGLFLYVLVNVCEM